MDILTVCLICRERPEVYEPEGRVTIWCPKCRACLMATRSIRDRLLNDKDAREAVKSDLQQAVKDGDAIRVVEDEAWTRTDIEGLRIEISTMPREF